MHDPPIRSGARLAKLLLVVAIRRAGFVPWVIAAGWLGLAAAQEPRMLRSFGLFLTTQAAAVASFVVAAVLAASLHMVRRTVPYLIACHILAIISVVVFSLGVGLLESLRQAPWQAELVAAAALGQAWLLAPLVIVIGQLVSMRNLWSVGHCLVLVVLTLSWLVRFEGGVWSTTSTVASMALLASAWVLANVHCHKKI